jgi:putative redox protein
MGAVVKASAVSVKDKKMMFTGAAGGHAVTLDYIPPYGDGSGFMPMQLYLVSLAACLGSTLRYLAGEHGLTISDISVDSRGTRRDHPPTGFGAIEFDIRVKSPDIDDETMKKLGGMAEKTYCPLTTMLKDDVAVTMTYHISRE